MRVRGKPVVFGEGNLISNQTAGCCSAAAQDGLIARIEFVVEAGPAGARAADPLRADLGAPSGHDRPPRHQGSASWNRTVSVAGRRRGSGRCAASAAVPPRSEMSVSPR